VQIPHRVRGPRPDLTLQLSYSNGTLHATVSGNFNDDLPLANVTIVGTTSKTNSMTVNCGQHDSQAHGSGHSAGNATTEPQSRYENNVLYLTGLESETQSGVWSSDLEIILT
jgi:alpha-glucosidase